MNNAQLVNLFKESTKNYSSNWGSEALIGEWLDEGQIDIILRTGCYNSSKNLTSVASQREYSLGSDVMKVNHVLFNSLEVQPTTMEQAQLQNGYPSETAGTPTHFYIRMEDVPYLCFTPPPSTDALTIAVHYLKRPPTLTSTDNNPVIPEQYHRLIVQHAMYNVLIKDAKMETASKWLDQYERRVTRMVAELNGYAKQRRKGFVPYGDEHLQKTLKSFTGDV
jgi:hypothetical protein